MAVVRGVRGQVALVVSLLCIIAFASGCFAAAGDVKALRLLWQAPIDARDVGYYTQSRIPTLSQSSPPLISYFDGRCGRLKAVECQDVTCRSRQTLVVEGECDERLTGRYQSMTVMADGNPFFAYFIDFALAVAKCSNPYCSASNTTTSSRVIDPVTAPTNGTGYYTDVEVGADGNAIVAYYDKLHVALKFAACLDADCSDAHITVVDAKHAGKYPSVAVGRDGLPVFSYYDVYSGLKFAKCGDMHCKNASLIRRSVLDNSTADVGRYTYIQVGSDGFPVMMYVDEINGHMKVAHCEDVDCLAFSTHVIDEIGVSAYGEFPEMQINPHNGLPVLSYFNQTSTTVSSLKVAQCFDLACSDALVQVIATAQCGFGRDSSLSFSPLGYVYVSFLDYKVGRFKKAALAVLVQADSDAAFAHEHELSPFDGDVYSSSQFRSSSRSASRGQPAHGLQLEIDDICQIF